MSSIIKKIQIRLFREDDSLAELTKLINRAYGQLAESGLKYVGTWQDDEITLRRIKDVECYVGVLDGVIISTIALRPPESGRGAEWYLRKDVAHFAQFGVLPEYQRQGIGTMMVRHCEVRANSMGAAELACDTAESAGHLIEWYKRMGYRFINYVDWEMTNYRSVIFSKTL